MTLKRVGRILVLTAIALVAIGVISLAQPLTIHLYHAGFYILLAALVMYMVGSHF